MTQVGAWREGAHLWKTIARTVMAASRRKAKAPRMDPITKERRSGSWADSSPEEPATQDHRRARPCMSTHPPIHRANSQRSATRSLHAVSTLEGSGRGCKAWKAPGPFLPSIQASSHLEAASGNRPFPRKGRGLKRSSPAPGSHRCGQGLAASQLPCWSRWSG